MTNILPLPSRTTDPHSTAPAAPFSALQHGPFSTAFVAVGAGRTLVRIAHRDQRPDAPCFSLSAPHLRHRLNDGFDPRRTVDGEPGAPDVPAGHAADVPEGSFESVALLAAIGSGDLGAFGAALMALGAQLVAEAGRRVTAPSD